MAVTFTFDPGKRFRLGSSGLMFYMCLYAHILGMCRCDEYARALYYCFAYFLIFLLEPALILLRFIQIQGYYCCILLFRAVNTEGSGSNSGYHLARSCLSMLLVLITMPCFAMLDVVWAFVSNIIVGINFFALPITGRFFYLYLHTSTINFYLL